MKLVLIALLGLVVTAASQPIDEPATPVAAAPVDETVIVKALESTDESDADLMPSEDALKIIGHKLQHWTKKCVKHGGCRGLGGYGGGYPSLGGYGLGGYGLGGYGLGGYDTLGLGYSGLYSPYGLGLGYGGLGYGGLGYGGLGYGGLGGYGLGGYGYGKKR